MVENLVANFAMLVTVNEPGARLIVSARREARGRYDRNNFPKKAFFGVIEAMERLGYLLRFPGTAHGERTTLEPSERLLESIPDSMCPNTVSRLEGAETIWLNMNEGGKKRKKWIDYSDTHLTRQMRKEMLTINRAINDAEITLSGISLGPLHLVRLFWTDARDNERFDLHGRIYRGPWQYLPKKERKNLRLNGHPIVELDFSSMFLRLAYCEAGLNQPDADPYECVESMSREATKLAINVLLCRSGPMRRLPSELKELLGAGWNGSRVTAALAHSQPGISRLFGTGCGLHLMYLESQVLVSALLRLIKEDIIGLPIHDGIFCEQRHEYACRAAMQDASEEVLGLRLPVSRK